DLLPQKGHTHLVGVGEAEGEPDVYLLLFFVYAAGFAAGIAARLLHMAQGLFQLRADAEGRFFGRKGVQSDVQRGVQLLVYHRFLQIGFFVFPIVPYFGADCNFFLAASQQAPSIWAPSSGGMGSRLNAPVRTLAARKAAPHTVSRADARAYQTAASRAFIPGPAAASTNRRPGVRRAPPTRIQRPVMVTSTTGSPPTTSANPRRRPHSCRAAATGPSRRTPLLSKYSRMYSSAQVHGGSRKTPLPTRTRRGNAGPLMPAGPAGP